MKTLIIILLTTLSSCALLKKDQQTLKKLNQKETAQLTEQRNIFNQKQEWILTDSNQSNLTALIWPKGKFTFSTLKGFEGEAEKIFIKSKQSSKKGITLKNETHKDSTLLKASYEKEKDTLTVVKKIKIKRRFSWYWLLLLPALYIAYRVYKA